jgi:DNA-binding NarL/FixJ family response regulator
MLYARVRTGGALERDYPQGPLPSKEAHEMKNPTTGRASDHPGGRLVSEPLREPDPEPAGKTPLRILIADDHEIVRRGVRAVLSSRSEWEVCAEATTGREAVAKAEQYKPDVVIMDIAMPDLNGLDAVRKIRKLLPETEAVILSLHFSPQLVQQVMDAGAHAYILKSDAHQHLLKAIEALVHHKTFFSPEAAKIIIDGICKEGPADPRTRGKSLTSREREVLQLLAEGKSSKEVAVALDVSVRTAETHRVNIMRKVDAHSVSDLVRYAVKNQMIEP